MESGDELLKRIQRLRGKIHKLIEEGIPLTNNEIIAISQELDNVLNKYEAQMIIEELLDIK